MSRTANRHAKARIVTAVDLFCGAGGASEGLLRACRKRGYRLNLIGINHWPLAIKTHSKNHDYAEHLCADINEVNPTRICPGGKLDVLLAGVECVFFSTARIEETMGKRGRPDAETDWTIACMECMATSTMHAAHAVNCPRCGAMRVRIRAGRPVKLRDPGGDLFDAWQRLRFSPYSGGRWEIPIAKGAVDTPPAAAPTDAREQEIIETLRSAPLLKRIEKLDRAGAMRILDAILIARAYWQPDRRMAERIKAATLYFQRGGSPANISLAELPEPDLLDAAGPLGAEAVAAYLMS